MFDPSTFDLQRWLTVPLTIYIRYALVCGLFYAVFYIWKRREWLYRKIQQRFPTDRDVLREALYSASTAVIFAGMAFVCLGTPLREHTQFYGDIHQYGVAYAVLIVPVTLIVHDAYFYWMHRLIHHPKIYRRVHLTHHLSVNPSPWAAYSFHPIEAVLEALILPILLFLLPLHPVSLLGFIALMLWMNVYGHLGYELFPAWLYQHPLGRWLNSGVYHNQHHEKFTGNYGLYFSWWDKWCGTLRTDSDAKVAEVQGRIAENRRGGTSPMPQEAK
ncbi:MAG: sterol desaturase family protein [Saprospiraceae bacterium]